MLHLLSKHIYKKLEEVDVIGKPHLLYYFGLAKTKNDFLSWEKKKKREKCDENIVVMAIELPDGKIITGKSSHLMVAAAAMILNAIKYLAGQSDEMFLIGEEILEATQRLKTDILKSDRSILNCEEILIALAVSKKGNGDAELAAGKLPRLRGCRAHCTAILSDQDEQTLSALGVDVTSDPEYVTTNLYTN